MTKEINTHYNSKCNGFGHNCKLLPKLTCDSQNLFFSNFLKTDAALLPEKLCHVENIAPGTAARGNMAKWVAASDVARPEVS